MRIRVINPTTTESTTTLIGKAARAVAGPGTLIEATTCAMGPSRIDSHYDEVLSIPGVLAAVGHGEREAVDGYVIAEFSDPGLLAARELARGPVVGMAEAAMRAATFLGRGFSVVTTVGRTAGRAWDLAERYGVGRFCLGVHACDVSIADLETSAQARQNVTRVCRSAVETDGADAVVLTTAGTRDLCATIARGLGVPVVDGVAAATAMVQALITLELATSARGEFAGPPPTAYSGLLAPFGGRAEG